MLHIACLLQCLELSRHGSMVTVTIIIIIDGKKPFGVGNWALVDFSNHHSFG